MYYYRARQYNPDWGRFLQADPIGYGDGLNLYAYVGNSPVSFVDPFGLSVGEISSGGYGLISTAGHLTLDVAGLVFEPADAINAAWYLGEGNYTDAALSSAALIPAVGIFATAGKWAGDVSLAANIGTNISQKQLRHIKGRPEWTARGQGGYLNSIDDAQSVLSAVHAGKTEFVGTTTQGFPVVRYNNIIGFNNNPGAGFIDQPTNVFIIKGTNSPSVVPTNPDWMPK